ncbi:MAG: baseplate J/gp47 family protein [Methanothrix sp.]|nr:baseplate J/gp47 family protein [Methanothrix sp.]
MRQEAPAFQAGEEVTVMPNSFMEFLDMSPEEIYEDWLKFITTRDPLLKDTSPASFNAVLAEAIASEFWIFLQLLKQKVKDVNILTAEGEALSEIVKSILPEGRRSGERATGTILFSRPTPAPSDIVIPAGTICAAVGDDRTLVEFETTETVTLAQNAFEVYAPARAIRAGTKGNVHAGAISIIRTPVLGITSCTNDMAFTGGTDMESDEDLRRRALYAIWTNGRATIPLIREHIDALEGVREVKVETLGQGDVLLVIDGDPASISSRVDTAIYENLAAGITACGVLGATLRPEGHTFEIGDTSGAPVWVRTLQYIPVHLEVPFQYITPLGQTKRGYAVFYAGTMPGDAVKAIVDADHPYATRIVSSSYIGSYSFDILMGHGTYPRLWVAPELQRVDIELEIVMTSTPEQDLLENIKTSLETALDAYKIGDPIEYADLVKYIYIDYTSSRAFRGIDDIKLFTITCKNETIDNFGEKIVLEDDERAVPGTITVSEAE